MWKGPSVVSCSRTAFREVCGVEMSESLSRIAEQNIRKCRLSAEQRSRIRIVCMDAAQFAIPENNCVLYLIIRSKKKLCERWLRTYASHYCEQNVRYSWRITIPWQARFLKP